MDRLKSDQICRNLFNWMIIGSLNKSALSWFSVGTVRLFETLFFLYLACEVLAKESTENFMAHLQMPWGVLGLVTQVVAFETAQHFYHSFCPSPFLSSKAESDIYESINKLRSQITSERDDVVQKLRGNIELLTGPDFQELSGGKSSSEGRIAFDAAMLKSDIEKIIIDTQQKLKEMTFSSLNETHPWIRWITGTLFMTAIVLALFHAYELLELVAHTTRSH